MPQCRLVIVRSEATKQSSSFSRPIASAIIAVVIVALVLILPQRAGRHPGARAAQGQPAVMHRPWLTNRARAKVSASFGEDGPLSRILYLAAVSAVCTNADMKAFYARLRGGSKAPKAALIAVARKLVVLANTLLSENCLWQAHAPT